MVLSLPFWDGFKLPPIFDSLGCFALEKNLRGLKTPTIHKNDSRRSIKKNLSTSRQIQYRYSMS